MTFLNTYNKGFSCYKYIPEIFSPVNGRLHSAGAISSSSKSSIFSFGLFSSKGAAVEEDRRTTRPTGKSNCLLV